MKPQPWRDIPKIPGPPMPRTPEPPKRTPQAPPPLTGTLRDFGFTDTLAPPVFDFHGGPQSRGPSWKLMAWSIAAFVIDACVTLALCCLFFFAILVVEKVTKLGLQLNAEFLRQVVGVVFVFLYGTYLTTLRIFLGHSLGEWACGLRLGEARQRFSSRYALDVMIRLGVVVGTGVVVLPFLSLVTGIDWAGRVSGLPLISVTPSVNGAPIIKKQK